MRRIIFLMFAICFGFFSVEATDLEQKAIADYDNKNYQEVITAYQDILEKKGASSELFYNLGNAYYKAGDNGRAVLSYERSLRLNPRNEDASSNLEFVRSKLLDRTDDGEDILTASAKQMQNFLSSDSWAVTGMIAFVLFLVGLALYFFVDSLSLRKIGFFGGFSLLAISVIANVFSYSSGKSLSDRSYAIVLADTAQLSTVSRAALAESERAFVLHEGAKVRKVDSLNTSEIDGKGLVWYRVRTADSREAWISGSAIEEI